MPRGDLVFFRIIYAWALCCLPECFLSWSVGSSSCVPKEKTETDKTWAVNSPFLSPFPLAPARWDHPHFPPACSLRATFPLKSVDSTSSAASASTEIRGGVHLGSSSSAGPAWSARRSRSSRPGARTRPCLEGSFGGGARPCLECPFGGAGAAVLGGSQIRQV
jgi:hypothetical protein